MGNVSAHFSRWEFACRCGCGFDRVDPRLVSILENVRRHFTAPVTINSGCRCEAYNKKAGGVQNSQHVQGIAADIVVEGVKPALVASYLESQHPDCGIGRYNTFTHIDVRGYAARWKG